MDPELEAIRAKRMAELAGSGGGSSSGSAGQGSFPGGMPGGRQGGGGGGEEDSAAQREQEEEMRRAVLSKIMVPDARERLSRIALVRPQKARAIQDLLIRMMQSGQLRGQITEDQLIDVLDQVEAAESSRSGGDKKEGSKIVFSRRKGLDDDDFDL